jgi:hypothetical protein
VTGIGEPTLVSSAPVSSSSNALAPPRVRNQYGVVTIEPRPNCAKLGTSGDNQWLEDKTIQLSARELEQGLEPVRHWVVGRYTEHAQRGVVVVIQTDFAGYEDVAKRLATKVAPLRLVLRPACHSRSELEEAQHVIVSMDWHPHAKEYTTAWYLDAELSRYIVTVDSRVPEVAQALRVRLGELVEVRAGRPHFGPKGSPGNTIEK